jgi:hypothetical protein
VNAAGQLIVCNACYANQVQVTGTNTVTMRRKGRGLLVELDGFSCLPQLFVPLEINSLLIVPIMVV